MAAANEHAVAAVHYGVLGVELAVGLFEGLGDTGYTLDDVHGLQEKGVDGGGVANDAYHGLVVALAHVGRKAFAFQPGHKMVQLLWRGGLFDYGYHQSGSSRVSSSGLSSSGLYMAMQRFLKFAQAFKKA